MNSTFLINQNARKTLFTCVVYINGQYFHVMNTIGKKLFEVRRIPSLSHGVLIKYNYIVYPSSQKHVLDGISFQANYQDHVVVHHDKTLNIKDQS